MEGATSDTDARLEPSGPAAPGPDGSDAPREARIRIFSPLKLRDFSLLWWGMSISLLGDGVYIVAITWLVFRITGTNPTALSAVFVAWTVPQVLFLLVAGVATDRFDRRAVLVASDVVRGISIAAVGVLVLTDALELWHLYILVAVYGAGEAFFMPAFGAIMPDVVPKHWLVQANSLAELARPFTLRLVGPALGGFLIQGFGVGTAFLFDAGTFVISLIAVLAMRRVPRVRDPSSLISARREIGEGLRFIRSRTWLWAGLGATGVALLVYFGPWTVLVPAVIRTELGGGAADFGLVLAFGGAGAIIASLFVGQGGLPRAPIVVVFASWAFTTLTLVGFGTATALWQMFLLSFFFYALFTLGQIIWFTLVQTHVPTALLGRVTSADWLVSSALIPVSVGLAGPLGKSFGTTTTLVAAGALAWAVLLGCLLIPGIRDVEEAEPQPASK